MSKENNDEENEEEIIKIRELIKLKSKN